MVIPKDVPLMIPLKVNVLLLTSTVLLAVNAWEALKPKVLLPAKFSWPVNAYGLDAVMLAVVSSVPPPNVSVPLPKDPPELVVELVPSLKVPAFNVTPPENVCSADSDNVPNPDFVNVGVVPDSGLCKLNTPPELTCISVLDDIEPPPDE